MMAVDNTKGIGNSDDADERKGLRENVKAKRTVRRRVKSTVHHVRYTGMNK